MGNYVAANMAGSSLAAAITATSTSISIQASDAAKFPVVNSGGVGSDYSLLTLQNAANAIEIVKVTRHDSGSSTFTIVRAQEGTAALVWAAGDSVACRLTAGVVNAAFVAATSSASSASSAASSAAAAQAAAAAVTMANFKLVQVGSVLCVQFNGATVLSIDSSGNLVSAQNVSAFGSP